MRKRRQLNYLSLVCLHASYVCTLAILVCCKNEQCRSFHYFFYRFFFLTVANIADGTAGFNNVIYKMKVKLEPLKKGFLHPHLTRKGIWNRWCSKFWVNFIAAAQFPLTYSWTKKKKKIIIYFTDSRNGIYIKDTKDIIIYSTEDYVKVWQK